ncbi:Zc3h12a-like ribonuclease NYN domain-containing protein [Ochromonadaceae sp. CCMP2298]|nr:Zc3h12a-like ribonuclease NYN domain-containing protein [Ochromonadaceae sp. CCMP2298]
MQVDEDYPAPAASASVLTLESDRLECVFADMVSNDPWDPAGGERPLVVLDCANIGWSYGVDRFSPTGLLIAMRHFHGLGVEVQAFLPANYLRENHQNNLRDRNRASGSGDGGGGGGGRTGVGEAVLAGEAADLRTLQSLAGSSLLTMVPSGDSDDAYFLNYARDRGGFVVTNDLCNDHMRGLLVPSVQTSMRQWLQDHRVGYAFLYGQQGRPSQFLCNPCSQMRQVLDAFAESKQQQQHNQQQQMEAASISSSSTSTSTSPPSILSAASKGGAWLRAVRHTTQLIQLLGDAASAPPSAPCDCDLELKFLLLTRASLLHKVGRVQWPR